jgi:catalase
MAEQRTTNASGAPVASDEHLLTVGPNGPTALQDAYVVQKMQHFNRGRVPERVVHAKGRAAHGFFEVAADVTQWTNAAFLSKVGSARRCSCASQPWRANWAAPTRCATRAGSR